VNLCTGSLREPHVLIKLKMETLNKYELARILGARALQISLGAPVLLDVPKSITTPIAIARMELGKDILPIAVKRN
jgi:DNA-directed RNA polymerase subunit K